MKNIYVVFEILFCMTAVIISSSGLVRADGDVSPLLFRRGNPSATGTVSSVRMPSRSIEGLQRRETGQRELTLGKAEWVQITIDGVPEFENAWRDSHGTIWGNTVVDEQGHRLKMNWRLAREYCDALGALLPDHGMVNRLIQDLQADPGVSRSYTPQILSGLGDHWFWMSSQPDSGDVVPWNYYYVFNGLRGAYDFFRPSVEAGVRCVTR